MKRLFFLFIPLVFFVAGVQGRTWTADNLPQPRQNDATNNVANPDGILSQPTVAQINALIADIEQQTKAQVAVAVIDNFNSPDIDSFATELFEKWGVGKDGINNGVLLVVAKDARKYAIRTGRGAGAVITDLQSGKIGSEIMAPNFRNGDFDKGVLLAVKQLHTIITDPEAAQAMLSDASREEESDAQTVLELVMFYLWCSVALTFFLAVWAIYHAKKTKTMERHQRYAKLHPMQRILYGLSFVGIGIPFLVYAPFKKIP